MPSGKILVVDDEEDTLTAIAFCLAQEGFAVAEARDGLEALQSMRTEHPAVVVLDVMLPGLNGYEVSRRIKESAAADSEKAPVKVLLLTARRVDSLEREEFLAAWSQADVVMYKPFEMDELLRQVTRLSALTRPPQEVSAPGEAAG